MVAGKETYTDFPHVLQDFSQILQVCYTFAINRILNPDVPCLSHRLHYSWDMLQSIPLYDPHKDACLF